MILQLVGDVCESHPLRSTTPLARGHGVFKTLFRFVVQDAADLGYRLVVGQAAHMSANMLLKCGLQPVAQCGWWFPQTQSGGFAIE
jgi:hypothetical protein